MSTSRHRQGSIFWALVLIAVGILFLLQNLYPAIHPWQLIAKFWPLLVIFWGISMLVQYFMARKHPESPPPRIFSPSQAVLLLILLILGTAFSRIVLTPWHEWPAITGLEGEQFAELFLNSYPFTQKVSQKVKENPRLLIVNRRGNIEVRGADQPDVTAVAQETIWAENEASARHTWNRLKFHFLETGNRYEWGSNADLLPHNGRNIRLDLLFQIPTKASADVVGNRGDIVIRGLQGDQTLTTRHGDTHVADVKGLVRVRQSRGSTEIQNVDGSVEIQGRGSDLAVKRVSGAVRIEGNFSGDLRFTDIAQTLRYKSSRTNLSVQRLSGKLSMDRGGLDAQGVDGPFQLTTRDKDIHCEDFKSSVRITDTNGNVHLRTAEPPTRAIEVDLKRGDISLSLPAGSNFQVDAVSRHGNVHSDFPGLKISHQQKLPSIQGSHGSGGPLIHLRSTYGSIRVMREKPQPASEPPSTTAGINQVPAPTHTLARKTVHWGFE